MADIYGRLMDGLRMAEAGRQESRRRGLADLMGKAYNAPAEQRGQIIGQMAGIDPDAAFAAQKQFGGMDDDKRAQISRHAQIFDALPDEQKAQAYPQLAAEVRNLTGMPIPDAYDPKYLPAIQRVAQWSGGATGGMVQSTKIGADGYYYTVNRAGQWVNSGVKANPNIRVMEQEGAMPYGVVTSGGVAGSIVPLGGAQPTPQGGAFTAGVGNAGASVAIDGVPPEQQQRIAQTVSLMRQAGYPDDQIDAWVTSQSQAAPAAPVQAGPVRTPTAGEKAYDAERAKQAATLEFSGPAAQAAAAQARAVEQAKAEGQAAGERGANSRTEKKLLDANNRDLQGTVDLINKILSRRGDFGGVTGVGALGSKIPGTRYADLAADLERLRGRSAFATLQQMRASSPTGGALGSITERELALLQNAAAALSNTQSPEKLVEALTEYRNALLETKRATSQAFADHYGDGQSPTAPPRPQTQADFDALPKGSLYVDPDDGKTYRKD